MSGTTTGLASTHDGATRIQITHDAGNRFWKVTDGQKDGIGFSLAAALHNYAKVTGRPVADAEDYLDAAQALQTLMGVES